MCRPKNTDIYYNKKMRKQCLIVAVVLLTLINLSLVEQEAHAQNNLQSGNSVGNDNSIKFTYYEDIEKLPIDLEKSLVSKILLLSNSTFVGQRRFAVSYVNMSDKYAFITVISQDSKNYDTEAVGAMEASRIFAAVKQWGAWRVGLEGTLEFNDIVKEFDPTFLDPSAKQILTQDSTRNVQVSALYKFPWKKRDSWKWWTRSPSKVWHGGHDSRCINYQSNPKVGKPPYCAIDFGANGVADKSVLAAAAGSVSVICTGAKTVNLRIIDFNGVRVDYYHIKKGTTTATIRDGYVNMGEKIGSVYVGDFKDGCGVAYSNSAGHLHLIVPTKGIVMDHWSFLYYYNFAVYQTGMKKSVGNTFVSLM